MIKILIQIDVEVCFFLNNKIYSNIGMSVTFIRENKLCCWKVAPAMNIGMKKMMRW